MQEKNCFNVNKTEAVLFDLHVNKCLYPTDSTKYLEILFTGS